MAGGGKTSPIAEDGEFLRRVMLDLVGYPPSLAQVKAFMADANPDKRSEKIDQLIDSEDWADRTAPALLRRLVRGLPTRSPS